MAGFEELVADELNLKSVRVVAPGSADPWPTRRKGATLESGRAAGRWMNGMR